MRSLPFLAVNHTLVIRSTISPGAQPPTPQKARPALRGGGGFASTPRRTASRMHLVGPHRKAVDASLRDAVGAPSSYFLRLFFLTGLAPCEGSVRSTFPSRSRTTTSEAGDRSKLRRLGVFVKVRPTRPRFRVISVPPRDSRHRACSDDAPLRSASRWPAAPASLALPLGRPSE